MSLLRGYRLPKSWLKHIQQPPRPPSDLRPLAPEIDRVILRCLEKDREDRFATVPDLQSELTRLKIHGERPTIVPHQTDSGLFSSAGPITSAETIADPTRRPPAAGRNDIARPQRGGVDHGAAADDDEHPAFLPSSLVLESVGVRRRPVLRLLLLALVACALAIGGVFLWASATLAWWRTFTAKTGHHRKAGESYGRAANVYHSI